MPTYDYKCADCGHVFEEFQSMKADPLKDCPKCGKPALKRLLAGGAGMIFKGSGFYRTDYAKPASSGTPASAPGSGEPSPKTETSEKKETPKPSGGASKDAT